MYYYTDLINNNLFSYNPDYKGYFDVKLGEIIENVENEEAFYKLQPNAQPVFTRTYFVLLERWFREKYKNWDELLNQEIIWS